MRVIHLPAIFDGGLRRAVLDYMSAPTELYDCLLWRCGRGDESTGGNDFVFPQTIKAFNLSVPLLKNAWKGQASADIVHQHGCWSLTSIAALFMKNRHYLPMIYSPHGAFIPSSLKRYKNIKNIYLAVWERHVLRAADCFHAVSEVEAESLRLLAGQRPIAVIPNGIDLEQTPLQDIDPNFWGRWNIPEKSFKILFLSRVVPDKGVDLLLSAMTQVAEHTPNAHCIVAGDGTSMYLGRMERFVNESRLRGRVTFVGPLEGVEKFTAYRNADVFVLPSRNEAQGIVVLEALSQRLPVIASRCTPYAGLVEAGCGWWEDNAPPVLATMLINASAMGRHARQVMGEKGRQFLAEHYAMTKVHAQFSQLYAWVADGMRPEHRPESVVGGMCKNAGRFDS